MTDTFEFTLDYPLTEEQWGMITDVDFDRTDRITFYTKHGKEVEFAKVIRCKDCENHGTRTNMCDIWHRHTNGEGYCHRAKAKSKEQNAKSKAEE